MNPFHIFNTRFSLTDATHMLFVLGIARVPEPPVFILIDTLKINDG